MALIIILFFAIAIGMFISFYKVDEPFMGVIAGFFVALGVCLLVCIFVCMPLSGISYDIGVPVIYEETTTPLVAMQDGTGSFIRSVNVKNDLKYFYLYPDEDGRGITSGQTDAKHSFINYTEDEPYVIIRKAKKFDSFFWNLITVPWTNEYFFYIPEGSIIQDYTIDLK